MDINGVGKYPTYWCVKNVENGWVGNGVAGIIIDS